jgi:hypothetical protein
MHYSVYAGLAFAAMFGVVGPMIARRIAPSAATWLLTVGGLLSGVSAFAAMTTLGLTLVGKDSTVAERGHWSISALRAANPVRWPIAVVALVGVAIAVVRVGRLGVRRVGVHRASRRASQLAVAADDDLIVLPHLSAEAYAVPGRPGRIFLTRGLLRLLTDDERHVVVEHERSHLRHRHHLHRLAVTIAAALNPLLATLPHSQEWATERWADEDAARNARRSVVASALRKASDFPDSPEVSLAITGSHVDRRVQALSQEPLRVRPGFVLIALGIVTLSVMGTTDAVQDTSALFHFAIAVHNAHQHLRLLVSHH